MASETMQRDPVLSPPKERHVPALLTYLQSNGKIPILEAAMQKPLNLIRNQSEGVLIILDDDHHDCI
jgi:hypothetical protein